MKVKIKKEGKHETYNIINSWSDVNLESWMQLVEKETESKTKEAEETIAALSDIPKKLVKELALRDVATIMGRIAEMQGERDTTLKKVFEIDGVEYGMHPDLSEMTLGEYADIESFIKAGLEDNMPEIMAVLFRPVIERNGDAYVIEAYDGRITMRAEIMKKMSAEQVQAALFFLSNLGTELLKILPSFLLELTQEMKGETQTEILQKSGDGSESSTASVIKT
tara:strand:+ start:227 stop:895 length:669 start_codon:yes stop_codon:yes gene_type:complete